MPFATQEQIDRAEQALGEWSEAYPEAAEALRKLWSELLMEVGHKRLGRILLGKEVLPAGG
jgi:hypothetical protein